MIPKKMESALNTQITKEAYSAHLYLAIASWCQQQGLNGCAAFYYSHAEEERGHMMKIFRYINERGGAAIVPAVKEPPQKFKSLMKVLEQTMDHEIMITKSIHQLVELSQSIKDYATHQFLQWFVEEQVEEESLFATVIDMLNLAGGENCKNLLMFDANIMKVQEKN